MSHPPAYEVIYAAVWRLWLFIYAVTPKVRIWIVTLHSCSIRLLACAPHFCLKLSVVASRVCMLLFSALLAVSSKLKTNKPKNFELIWQHVSWPVSLSSGIQTNGLDFQRQLVPTTSAITNAHAALLQQVTHDGVDTTSETFIWPVFVAAADVSRLIFWL